MNEQANKQKITTQWILIRGLGREARHWGEFPAELEKTLSIDGESARVDAIDLPGAGRYSEMASPISIARITDFARDKFLEIRERQRRSGEMPAQRTFIVAISLGGMIATRWMERWPSDFKAAILINTSFKGVSPIHRRLSPSALKHLFQVMRAREAVARELGVLKMVSNRPEIYDETAKEWASYALERPISVENFGRQLFAAAAFTTGLKQVPIPVLILNSRGDRMVHPSCSEMIAAKWRAQLEQHNSAGHDLPLDDGPWVVEQIQAFYRALPESVG